MHMRVAAYAVIVDHDGRLLLAHWNHPRGGGAWTLPGGGLDEGEHPEDAARREVQEETGYDVVIDRILGVDSAVIPAARRLQPGANEAMHALRIIYAATIVGGELRDEVGGSTDRAEWFEWDAVDDLHRVELVDKARSMYWISR